MEQFETKKFQAEVVGIADKQVSIVPKSGPYHDKLYGMTPPRNTSFEIGDTVVIELDATGLKPRWHYT